MKKTLTGPAALAVLAAFAAGCGSDSPDSATPGALSAEEREELCEAEEAVLLIGPTAFRQESAEKYKVSADEIDTVLADC